MNLSYNLTNRYIFFLWKGYYCGCFDKKDKELYLLWKDDEMAKEIKDRLDELDYEEIK